MPRASLCPTHGIVPRLPCAACKRESPYRTAAWRNLRNAKVREQPCCEQCGSTIRLNVHHITGRRITGLIVDLDELQVLCHPCHMRVEGDRRKVTGGPQTARNAPHTPSVHGGTYPIGMNPCG